MDNIPVLYIRKRDTGGGAAASRPGLRLYKSRILHAERAMRHLAGVAILPYGNLTGGEVYSRFDPAVEAFYFACSKEVSRRCVGWSEMAQTHDEYAACPGETLSECMARKGRICVNCADPCSRDLMIRMKLPAGNYREQDSGNSIRFKTFGCHIRLRRK